MRPLKFVLPALLAAAVLVPVSAAIKAMTLREMMEITTDVIVGEIVAKQTLRDDRAMEGGVYTRITVDGESLRTGQTGRFEMLYLGSHDPADAFMSSEMPALQDTRLGGEGVFFTYPKPELDGQAMVASWSAVYRIERGFGEPVVIGKGEGSAFTANTKLSQARERVVAAHAAILAAKTTAPGLQK